MSFALAFAFLALVVLGGWWLNLRRELKKVQAARIPRAPAPYHSVSIRAAASACAAARQLHGERFLVDHAPRLPLPGCNRSDCTCTYRHHRDRRHHNRRDPHASLRHLHFGEPREERRQSAGRRKSDLLVQPLL